MATYTFYPSTGNSAYMSCFDTGGSYSKARQGTGSIGFSVGATAAAVGQLRAGSLYQCLECLYEFDTSSLAGKTITSATLSVYVSGRLNDVGYTVEARLYDYGTTIANADWLAGSLMSGKTLLATLADTAAAAGAYRAFTDVAFPANINKTGKTRIGLFNSNQRLNNAPGNGVDEYINIDGEAGTNPPKLVVVTSEAEGTLTATLAGDTLSSAAVLSISGAVTATFADDTLSSSAALSSAGTGSAVITLADDTISIVMATETHGYLEVTNNDDTLTTVALVDITGALTATLGNDTLDAIGVRPITGTLTVTLGDDTLTTSTLVGIGGALAATLADDTLAAAESTPTWPTVYGFPQAPLDGTWQPSLGDDVLRSDREIGARLRRGRNGGNYTEASFEVLLKSRPQRIEMDRFFAGDCGFGTRPFYWMDPETGQLEKWTWAAPPVFRDAGPELRRVQVSLRREAA